jgi:hypothetical protein
VVIETGLQGTASILFLAASGHRYEHCWSQLRVFPQPALPARPGRRAETLTLQRCRAPVKTTDNYFSLELEKPRVRAPR